MDKGETVWILEHVYEINNFEEIKHIGVFSSKEKAKNVVNELKMLPGFKNHPVECFQISETKIDQYEWKEGFISWKEANE